MYAHHPPGMSGVKNDHLRVLTIQSHTVRGAGTAAAASRGC